MCDCIEQVDLLLATKNAKLALTISLVKNCMAFPSIETEKIDRKFRGSNPVVVPRFCPFCGVKYEKDKPPEEKPYTLDSLDREINDGRA